jgi:hypothetical protein
MALASGSGGSFKKTKLKVSENLSFFYIKLKP